MANPRKPSRLQDTMEFRSMWSSGAPIEYIADKHGLTRSTVNRQASKFGYPNRGKKNNLLGNMPTTLAVDDPARNVPEVITPPKQSHPRWPVEYDAAILKTDGKYSRIANLSKSLGRSVNAILARWHQLRAM